VLGEGESERCCVLDLLCFSDVALERLNRCGLIFFIGHGGVGVAKVIHWSIVSRGSGCVCIGCSGESAKEGRWGGRDKDHVPS